jgi:ABC-type branched-subunit amino acid transport system permease subunit
LPQFLADLLTSTQWLGAIAAGLCYVGAVLGVFITFRILAFPDLTIEGSFPLGAGVAAIFLSNNWSQWLSLPIAFGLGSLAGMATAWLATRLKINGLLASIIVALGLYWPWHHRSQSHGESTGPDLRRAFSRSNGAAALRGAEGRVSCGA